MMHARQQNEEDIKLYNKNMQQHNRVTAKELQGAAAAPHNTQNANIEFR